MNQIDKYYVNMLEVGFLMLKFALESGREDWLRAELDLLHNVPTLIGEKNRERHRYFWCKERAFYADWASELGQEAVKSCMLTYYSPIWNDMEPLIKKFIK